MRAKNVFTLLLRGRDQGSCAARLFVTKSAHVFIYIPVPALLFTLLTTSRDSSSTGSKESHIARGAQVAPLFHGTVKMPLGVRVRA